MWEVGIDVVWNRVAEQEGEMLAKIGTVALTNHGHFHDIDTGIEQLLLCWSVVALLSLSAQSSLLLIASV